MQTLDYVGNGYAYLRNETKSGQVIITIKVSTGSDSATSVSI